MLTTLKPPPSGPIVYPESDGKPMADNTRQFMWIQVLYGNIAALFRAALDVFVAGDLLWYPVKDEAEIRAAPDVLVAFGRPKGHRGSYRQWEEGDIAPQVVFEVLSPSNDHLEMIEKHSFYEDHGVEEYYIYHPERSKLVIYLRKDQQLLRHKPAHGFVSPRLKVRFDLSGDEMAVFYPDGRRFLTFEQLAAERDQAEQRARRMAELGRKARKGQATAEEIAELECLEEQSSPAS